MGKVYVGDVGTIITLNYGLDTSTATQAKIKARKPVSGDEVEWAATPAVIDGETTGLTYTVEADDLDEVGDWRLQTWAAFDGGEWSGETYKMRVWPKYG